MRSAITISLVPEARGGPWVYWDDFAAACRQAAALGFDAVELFPRSADEIDAPLFKSILEEHSLALAAVGTGAGWGVHKLRLTDPDPAVRERAYEFASALVETAGALGAPAVVGSMQGRFDGAVSREQALTWLAEAVDRLAAIAAKHGTLLLVEPLNRYETNLLLNLRDGSQFLDRVKATNVRLLGDLFHMNLEEVNLASSIRLAEGRLGHIHFADSNRRAVGFGHTDMGPVAEALREIGYNGYISAEALALPDSESAARQTIASFRKWFPMH